MRLAGPREVTAESCSRGSRVSRCLLVGTGSVEGHRAVLGSLALLGTWSLTAALRGLTKRCSSTKSDPNRTVLRHTPS